MARPANLLGHHFKAALDAATDALHETAVRNNRTVTEMGCGSAELVSLIDRFMVNPPTDPMRYVDFLSRIRAELAQRAVGESETQQRLIETNAVIMNGLVHGTNELRNLYEQHGSYAHRKSR